jgi:hypothetical protein
MLFIKQRVEGNNLHTSFRVESDISTYSLIVECDISTPLINSGKLMSPPIH